MGSSITLRTHNHDSERSRTRPQLLEEAARASLNLDANVAFTDAEWARARTRLLEFVTLLRDWAQHATTIGYGVHRALSGVQIGATIGRPIELSDMISSP
jgi:hypothetical protein